MAEINITVNTARQIAHVLEINLSELFRGLNRLVALPQLAEPNALVHGARIAVV